MLNAKVQIGTHNVLFVTLDTLRYDVAARLYAEGRTPNLAAVLPASGWERRHSPGSFTFAAHAAFFAGFLPTPVTPGCHPRLFAARFPGSETTGEGTFVFDAPDIVTGLRGLGYRTICVGGTGFFNKQTPLGCVLPGLFEESVWSPELGVTDPRSTENQVRAAVQMVGREATPSADFPPGDVASWGVGSALGSASRLTFMFLNVSAIHQPNRFYVAGAPTDTIESHAAALEYVDSQLGVLFRHLRKRGPWLCVVCSDHGTAYGEGGYTGHRVGHPVVWDVPYAEFVLPGETP
jgi:hypothetical protein